MARRPSRPSPCSTGAAGHGQRAVRRSTRATEGLATESDAFASRLAAVSAGGCTRTGNVMGHSSRATSSRLSSAVSDLLIPRPMARSVPSATAADAHWLRSGLFVKLAGSRGYLRPRAPRSSHDPQYGQCRWPAHDNTGGGSPPHPTPHTACTRSTLSPYVHTRDLSTSRSMHTTPHTLYTFTLAPFTLRATSHTHTTHPL